MAGGVLDVAAGGSPFGKISDLAAKLNMPVVEVMRLAHSQPLALATLAANAGVAPPKDKPSLGAAIGAPNAPTIGSRFGITPTRDASLDAPAASGATAAVPAAAIPKPVPSKLGANVPITDPTFAAPATPAAGAVAPAAVAPAPTPVPPAAAPVTDAMMASVVTGAQGGHAYPLGADTTTPTQMPPSSSSAIDALALGKALSGVQAPPNPTVLPPPSAPSRSYLAPRNDLGTLLASITAQRKQPTLKGSI